MTLTVKVSDPILVFNRKEARTLGIDHFPDGTMGYIDKNGKRLFVGPNRPDTFLFDEEGHIAQKVEVKKGKDFFSLCLQGGQIWEDNKTKNMFMFYHAEDHTKGFKKFHSHIGICKSHNGGKSFIDLGSALSPYLKIGDSYKQVEVCGGTVFEKDGYVYVWYTDYLEPSKQSLAIARCLISDIQSSTITFHKYYNGNFNSSGIGGIFTPIFEKKLTWPCVGFDAKLKKFIMVYTTNKTMRMCVSENMIDRKDDILLFDERGKEVFYPTIVSNQKQSHTQGVFYIYYTSSWKGAFRRRKDAKFMKREIEIMK